jgi:hypothetical protein
LVEREQYYLDKMKVYEEGYNMSLRADRPTGMKGKTHSLESRSKMSKALLGLKRTEESRKRIGESSKGRKHSNESKRKISARLKGGKGNPGYKFSEEAKQQLILGLVERAKDPAYIKKLSDAQKNRFANNPQAKFDCTQHFVGIPLEKEHKEKISKALKGKPRGTRWVTNGTINKLIKSEEIEGYLKENWWFGKTVSQTTREKLSAARCK